MSNDVTSRRKGSPGTLTGSLTAPELILSIFDSARDPVLNAAYLVSAGELFGIDARAVRVALGRLVRRRILRQVGRGRYGIGEAGAGLHRTVRAWRDVEAELVPWPGGWLMVYAGALGRADKTAVRGRERALRMRGFAGLDHGGLWVRPDNLSASLPEVGEQLVALGLEADCLTLHVDAAQPADLINPAALWDVSALEARYAARLQQLRESRARIPGLAAHDAAREALVLGRAVIREILIDPLLPDEMINTTARRQMIEEMVSYDRLGKACWAGLFA